MKSDQSRPISSLIFSSVVCFYLTIFMCHERKQAGSLDV